MELIRMKQEPALCSQQVISSPVAQFEEPTSGACQDRSTLAIHQTMLMQQIIRAESFALAAAQDLTKYAAAEHAESCAAA